MIKKSLTALLLLNALGFSQQQYIPGHLILILNSPANLTFTNSGYSTGIEPLDRGLKELQVSQLSQPLSKFSSYPERDKILLLKFPANLNLDEIRAKLQKVPEIASISFHHLYHCTSAPDDPLFNQQYYLNRIDAPAGWGLTASAQTVIIGIIDSGVDYTHPDLVQNIWLNPGEDQAPVGTLDSSDFNGLDDDGNGFIDDIRGWDFVDQPELPIGSDYLEPDNDPMDFYGHGTAVAGIAAAVIDNSVGIAGTANNALIMPLRAGSENLMSELAIAQAILYAVEEGAEVINLSFASSASSPLLQDIISYASINDVLVVAAAGDVSSAPGYPAAYDQSLSVGAVDQNDLTAQFSYQGSSLDIVAPGVGIISTLPGGGYGCFQGGNGTSFAAPMVSAAAAMLKGLHPQYSAEEIKGILLTSAEDLYSPGWDSSSGQGRLNVYQALLAPGPLTAQITSPASGSGFGGDTLSIEGTAAGLYLSSYQLYYGLGENPSEWMLFRNILSRQTVEAQLGLLLFDSTFADTIYSLKLSVQDQFGNILEDKVHFEYITSPPQISNICFYPAVQGDIYASIIYFNTDQICTPNLFITNSSNSDTFRFNYYDTIHYLFLSQEDPSETGIYDCQIIAKNLASIGTVSDNFIDALILNQAPYNSGLYFIKSVDILPSGRIGNEAIDFDEDGNLEILLQQDLPGDNDTLRLYEYAGSVFQPSGYTFGLNFPQDVGDSDEDGLFEIMGVGEGRTYIYEQATSGAFPQNLIFADSSLCYGSRLLNLIPGDGHGEIFLLKGNSLILYLHYPSGTMEIAAEIALPESAVPATIPSEWEDFDGDGGMEAVFSDQDGHICVYGLNADFQMSEIFSDSMPFLEVGNYIASGDFDGDTEPEFAVGGIAPHPAYSLSGASNFFQLYIYDFNLNSGFYRADSFNFLNVSSPEYFDLGISAGEVDNDGRAEIALSLHPDLYLVEFEDDHYQVTYHYTPCASNRILIEDLDGNGKGEMLINRGDYFSAFEIFGGTNLPIPMGLEVISLGDTALQLSWNPVPDPTIVFYQISRGSSPDILSDYVFVYYPQTTYIDENVIEDSIYYYAVSSYKSGIYSPYSQIVQGIPNDKPRFVDLRADPEHPHIIRIYFSEPMSADAGVCSKYLIDPSLGFPNSAILSEPDSVVLLTFELPLMDSTTYRISMGEMADKQGNYTSPDTIYFLSPVYQEEEPILKSAVFIGNGVQLEFSLAMDPDTLSRIDRYSITYNDGAGVINITSIEPDTLNNKLVRLYISSATPMGALGQIYVISAHDLYSMAGQPLDDAHASVTISLTLSNLNNVYAYPNPYRAGDTVGGEACVIIANVTPSAKVKIFNLLGEVVKEIDCNLTYGGVKWYLDNKKGELVGNGVYIYCIENQGDRTFGKIAVMR